MLIVEDDPGIREALTDLFLDEGWEVVTCPDGRQALEELRTSAPPDLIILDLMLPVMDGWEFRTHQRADPTLAAIPVLVISADGSPKAAAIHADAYMRKPFRASDLLRQVDRILLEHENRRMRERLEHAQRLAALGTLAAGVGHEINNPLAYVLMNLRIVGETLVRMKGDVESVRQGPLEAHARAACDDLDHRLNDVTELVQGAQTGSDRIRTIVQNLTLIARSPEDRRGLLQMRDVAEVALQMAANHMRRARVVRDYQDTPPVFGDETRLVQVLLNLLVNASQALPEGGSGSSEIRVRVRAGDTANVVVEVADSGAGIPAAVKQRLFEPFFTTKPAGLGTGLGLSICRGIVVSHGGTIDVESEVGRGSVFRVILPAAATVGPPAAKGPSEPVAAQGAGRAAGSRRPQILVVEDEPALSSSIKRLLEDEHDVTIVASARAALDLLETGKACDLILCDLMMPDISGPELYREIEHKLAHLAERVVFLTGGAYTAAAQRFVDQTPRLVLKKPFTPDELRDAVRSVLGAARA